jgi:uncharacterized protein YecE (DUF72 family)
MAILSLYPEFIGGERAEYTWVEQDFLEIRAHFIWNDFDYRNAEDRLINLKQRLAALQVKVEKTYHYLQGWP